jgi:flagellar basal body P-ring protein FlgI
MIMGDSQLVALAQGLCVVRGCSAATAEAGIAASRTVSSAANTAVASVQRRLIDDALWPHVLIALDWAGVAANRIPACPRC